jgi:hypothetical protein
VVDIRKWLVETKVADIIKVEEHESHTQKATLDDVKTYGLKVRRVIAAVSKSLAAIVGLVVSLDSLGRIMRWLLRCLDNDPTATLVFRVTLSLLLIFGLRALKGTLRF